MKTSVASNSTPLVLNTLASSIVSATPLPSSFTPGADESGSAKVIGCVLPALRAFCPPATATVS
jgi:hypothetical protein